MSEPPKAFVLSVYMINSNIPISENEYLFKQRNRFSITEKFHQDTFENISELEILMLICLCWRVCFGFVGRHHPCLKSIWCCLILSVVWWNLRGGQAVADRGVVLQMCHRVHFYTSQSKQCLVNTITQM